MEISGKVKAVLDQQTFGSGFTKREVVITTPEQYPQHLIVEFVQDKVSLLSDLAIGDEITIGINLRGREWQAPDGTIKYFNSIQGWRLDKKGLEQDAQAVAPPPLEEDFGGASFTAEADDMDDSPF